MLCHIDLIGLSLAGATLLRKSVEFGGCLRSSLLFDGVSFVGRGSRLFSL